MGISFWLISPGEVYQWISALILGWSVSLAWTQLVAFGEGHVGRIAGLSLFAGAAIVYSIIHTAFYRLLHDTVQKGIQPPTPTAILFLFILLVGGALGAWLVHNRSSNLYAFIYLWLVRFGDPQSNLVESHPKYLTKSLFRGGNLR